MSGTLPLFEKYPALSGLPYVRLGLFPTPVQELHGLSESDNRVFIKRDDLSGLEYGGNKCASWSLLWAKPKPTAVRM